MFVSNSTMFVSSLGMLFRLFVLAEIMMVGRLVMMVGGSARTSACDDRAPPRARPLFRHLTSA
jgi:hypothetical protein